MTFSQRLPVAVAVVLPGMLLGSAHACGSGQGEPVFDELLGGDTTAFSAGSNAFELSARNLTNEVSPRIAPAIIGMGLLEAVPQGRILALADPEDADGDGISGRPNYGVGLAPGELRAGTLWLEGGLANYPAVGTRSGGNRKRTHSVLARRACTEYRRGNSVAWGRGQGFPRCLQGPVGGREDGLD